MNIFDVIFRQRFLEEAFIDYRKLISYEYQDNTIYMRCQCLTPQMVDILVRVCKDLCFDFDITAEDHFENPIMLITLWSNI